MHNIHNAFCVYRRYMFYVLYVACFMFIYNYQSFPCDGEKDYYQRQKQSSVYTRERIRDSSRYFTYRV